MNKVYISGPMTGLKDLNRKAFDEATEVWNNKGYKAINPFTLAEQHLPYNELLANDLMHLSYCDAIALLPGWEQSKGARLELLFALDYVHIPVYDAITMESMQIITTLFLQYKQKEVVKHD